MTLAASPSKVIYAGDGVTTAFVYTFEILTNDGSDIQATVFDNATPPNAYPLTGNFTVNTDNQQLSYPTVGGVAPLGPGVNALPQGWQIVLNRVELLDSNLVLTDEGGISLPAIEEAIDYLTAISQQLQEQLNRATLLPINTPGPAQAVALPTAIPVGVLQVNGTWAQLVAYAAAAPTVQFFGLVTSGDQKGAQLFYSGDVTDGNNGFIALGAG